MRADTIRDGTGERRMWDDTVTIEDTALDEPAVVLDEVDDPPTAKHHVIWVDELLDACAPAEILN